MNKPKAKGSIISAIFFFIFGTIFILVINMFPTPEDILENGGEKVNAIVLDFDSEDTYTIVQIDDEDSFYDGDIVRVSQYSSDLHIGGTTTVYYDGETLVLSSSVMLITIFKIIGRGCQAIAGFILVLLVIKFIIFALKVGVAGLAIGSIANEVQQQENFNNQFYGNPEGRTNPYDTQGYSQYDNQYGNQYDNQYQNQYQQPYGNQYNQQYQQPYNQQQYNQQYQNQQYQNQQYQNQQYQNSYSQQNYTQQNNGNNYYNQ